MNKKGLPKTRQAFILSCKPTYPISPPNYCS